MSQLSVFLFAALAIGVAFLLGFVPLGPSCATEPLPPNGLRGAEQGSLALRRPEFAFYPDNNRGAPRTNGAEGALLPSARAISNAVFAQSSPRPDPRLTALAVFFGQFLDHDLSLFEASEERARDICERQGLRFVPGSELPIPVPENDPQFHEPLDFERSPRCEKNGVPTQFNAITHGIDASNVYGSTAAALAAVRGAGGTLKTSANGKMLPLLDQLSEQDRSALHMGLCDNGRSCFGAGDERANEHVILSGFHTVFVREHNYHVARLHAANPALTPDELFAQAQRIVRAELQSIVYNEFLPAVLGDECPALSAPRTTCGQSSAESVRIDVLFATAAYRFGHSGLPAKLETRTSTCAASTPRELGRLFGLQAQDITEKDFAELFSGLAMQPSESLDNKVVDGVRTLLFANPRTGAGGLDLVAFNIQRGRDHGLRSFNTIRRALGLAPRNFRDFGAEGVKLEQVYASPEDIDAFVGILSEQPHRTSRLGEVGTKVLCEQFTRSRALDPHFYTCFDDLRVYERTRLSDILARTFPDYSFAPNVFVQRHARA